jgi:EAL domain-containing protein (putative c-di-GMP-specific phosphodiesterase class I)
MKGVAEGVENLAQLDFLRNLGCDEVQGYHLSTPLLYDRLVKWLADRGPVNGGENPFGAKVLPMRSE